METSRNARKRKRENPEEMGSTCCKAAEAGLGTYTKTPTDPASPSPKKGKKYKLSKSQLEKKVQSLESELQRLEDGKGEYKNAADDANRQKVAIEEMNNTLDKELEDAKRQIANDEKRIKDLSQRLEIAKKEKEESAERNKELDAQLKEANMGQEKAEKETKKLVEKLNDAMRNITETEQKNKNLEKQLNDASKLSKGDGEMRQISVPQSTDTSRPNEDKRKHERLVEQLKDAEKTNRDLERRLTDLKQQLDTANEQNSNLLYRVSELAGAKLSAGNPNLVDISDENRPTKLAERYNELYDNDWTDAFDTLTDSGQTDEMAIEKLKDVLMTVFEGCREFTTEDLESFYQTVLKRFHYDENSTEAIVLQKQYIDRRKKMYTNYKTDLKEKMENRLKAILSEQERSSLKHFIDETADICLLMCLQDPLVVIESGDPGEAFDTSKYKAYTASGKIIDYIVWPALRLHKGGPLLGKGIAQGRKDKDLIEMKKGTQAQTEPTRPQTPPPDYAKDRGAQVGATNQRNTERSDKQATGQAISVTNQIPQTHKDQRQASEAAFTTHSGTQSIPKNSGSQQKKPAPTAPTGTTISNKPASNQGRKNTSVITVVSSDSKTTRI